MTRMTPAQWAAAHPKDLPPTTEILQNRRAYHYFLTYQCDPSMKNRQTTLAAAYRELGRPGIRCIAHWLGQNVDLMITRSRRALADFDRQKKGA